MVFLQGGGLNGGADLAGLARGVVLNVGTDGHQRLLWRGPPPWRDHDRSNGVVVHPHVAAHMSTPEHVNHAPELIGSCLDLASPSRGRICASLYLQPLPHEILFHRQMVPYSRRKQWLLKTFTGRR